VKIMEPKEPAPLPATRLDPDTARLIDALMAQPIKGRPAVIVVGDPDVTGFTPAPAPKAES
jgi:hypothetical protein